MAPSVTFDEVVKWLSPVRVYGNAPAAGFLGIGTDSRKVEKGSLFVALRGENFDGHAFVENSLTAGAQGAVVAQGHALPKDVPAGVVYFEVPDTLTALGQLALGYRQKFKIPIAAVTGSNGKTTTKEMIARIFEQRGPVLKTQGNLNNEVGVPLTLFGLTEQHTAAVVEMGMNHFGEIARLTRMTVPTAGLITVVQAAHIEGVGSIEGVAQAKGEMFENLDPSATAVVNLDDPRVAQQRTRFSGRAVTFGQSENADVRLVSSDPVGLEGQKLKVRVKGSGEVEFVLPLIGAHNALNATAAFAMAWALGYSVETCAEGLRQAAPYSRRLNVAKAPQGYVVIDDCYNANPSSMDAALKTVADRATSTGKAWAILGDMLELGAMETSAHEDLGRWAGERLSGVAFFGPRSQNSYQRAKEMLASDRCAHFEAIEPLVAWIRSKLQPGDVVLVKGSRGMKLERAVDGLMHS